MATITNIEDIRQDSRERRAEERLRLCAEDFAKEAISLLPIITRAALQLSDSNKAYRIMRGVCHALEAYNDLL